MLYVAISLFLLVTTGVAVLAFVNFLNEVPISLIIWQAPAFSVGVLCLIAFVLGALLLYFVSFAAARRETQELQKLRRRVAELEQRNLNSSSAAAQFMSMPGMPNVDVSDMTTLH
jgi:uncharacterized integral membrane protein